MKDLWRKIGAWSLYALIGFGLGCMVMFGVYGMWYWAVAIGICFAGVIGAEIVSFIIKKKSISSQYGEWIKRQPLPALIALALFALAMLALEIHLVAYGFR